MNKEDLILLQQEEKEEIREAIPKYEENVVLLQTLLKVFTEEQLGMISDLVHNEIESCVDYLTDVKIEEKEYWNTHTTKLKGISEKLNPLLDIMSCLIECYTLTQKEEYIEVIGE